MQRRTRWWVTGAVVVVAAAATTTAVVYSRSDHPRGLASPQRAAARFVTAVNDGDKEAAVAVACAAFADQARAAAHTGGENGIDFTMGAVERTGTSAAIAEVTQRLDLQGGPQRVTLVLELAGADGRWLVCGQH